MEKQRISGLQGFIAMSPLIVFLVLYLVTSLVIGDFYKMPISIAFLASAVYAVAITRGKTLRERIDAFSTGAANPNIMQMIWIFVLAGAFAYGAKEIGSVTATVSLSLSLLPDALIPAGIFLSACFISLSFGTSVGTIVALAPVAVGIAETTGADMAFMLGIVVGGAFFGDNLSFISDTTVAATRTQGCSMIDKVRANSKVVIPAAVIALALYVFIGLEGYIAHVNPPEVDYVKIVPYLVVLLCALAGINVSLVLILGIVSVGIVGLGTSSSNIFDVVGAMGEGVDSMGGLIIVTLLAGGLLELIRVNGGIEYILQSLTSHIRGTKGAKFSIAALVSLANACTANNTIAIITVGPIASDIAKRYGISPRKSASILDTFSCVVQGALPYGAQVLMASSLSGVSPLSIIACLYYPMAVFVCSVLAIWLSSTSVSANEV